MWPSGVLIAATFPDGRYSIAPSSYTWATQGRADHERDGRARLGDTDGAQHSARRMQSFGVNT
jgi:hypothetical protein